MLRLSLAAVALLAVAAPAIARADDEAPADEAPTDEAPVEKGRPVDKGTIGVGIVLGEPTGITAKLYLSDDRAIQIDAGSALVGGGIQISGDYLFHPWILEDRDSFVMPVYLGPGVRFIQYSDGRGTTYFAAGVRGVIGLLFDFKSVPLDTFVEVAGVGEYRFKSGKGFGVALNAGAGIRYYF